MKPRRSAPAAAGFTLIEIMLALAILGMIMATLWGMFTQTAKAKQRFEAAQERLHTARLALMRMTREIEMAYVGSETTLVQEKRTMFVGTAHPDIDELRFSYFGHQRLRADATEGDTAVVLYYGERDPDDRSVVNIMRRETRRLDYRDPSSIPGEAYILCPNVSRLKFSYYDPRKREWRDEWSTLSADGQLYPPSHVRIMLTVYDERGREVTYTSAARIQMTELVRYQAGAG